MLGQQVAVGDGGVAAAGDLDTCGHVTRAAAGHAQPHLDLDRDGRGGGRRVAGLLDLVVVHFRWESDTNLVSDATAAGDWDIATMNILLGK